MGSRDRVRGAARPGDRLIGCEVHFAALDHFPFDLPAGIPKRSEDLVFWIVDQHVDELGTTVGRALLEPTRIYARAVRKLLAYYTVKSVFHGIAHITGGGLHENLARIMPPGCRAIIERGSWTVSPVFGWLARLGEVDADDAAVGEVAGVADAVATAAVGGSSEEEFAVGSDGEDGNFYGEARAQDAAVDVAGEIAANVSGEIERAEVAKANKAGQLPSFDDNYGGK